MVLDKKMYIYAGIGIAVIVLAIIIIVRKRASKSYVAVTSVTAGQKVYPAGSNSNVRRDPSTANPPLGNKKAGSLIGYTTGTAKQMSDGIWYEVKSQWGVAWVRSDVVKLV